MFGSKHKIAIEGELFERLEKAARIAGYATVDEFILHILETAATPPGGEESEEEVRKRLQGLGYLE